MRQLVRVVLYVLVDRRPADSRLRRTTRTNCHIYTIYTLLHPDDGLLASLQHAEV
jgi:transcription initiation factor IIE alpha subunit